MSIVDWSTKGAASLSLRGRPRRLKPAARSGRVESGDLLLDERQEFMGLRVVGVEADGFADVGEGVGTDHAAPGTRP